MKNKRAAMELTVGTIVTIILLMSALVLGLILTNTIFSKTTENVNNIDTQVKGQINDLFGEEGTGFVIKLGNENTATVKQGTEDFGIPIGFSPTNPKAWGNNPTNRNGCTYYITPLTGANYCISQGWTDPCSSVVTGCGSASAGEMFESFESNVGYSLIKIDIPANVPPCLQRFTITVQCSAPYTSEYIQQSFDIQIIKKGIF